MFQQTLQLPSSGWLNLGVVWGPFGSQTVWRLWQSGSRSQHFIWHTIMEVVEMSEQLHSMNQDDGYRPSKDWHHFFPPPHMHPHSSTSSEQLNASCAHHMYFLCHQDKCCLLYEHWALQNLLITSFHDPPLHVSSKPFSLSRRGFPSPSYSDCNLLHPAHWYIYRRAPS
jgi:hypothetical protein